MYRVKTIETEYNTYKVGYGYSRISKTSYEEQQERKERFIKMLIQRLAALLLIIISIAGTVISKEGAFLIMTLFGLCVMVTKEHVFNS